MSVGQDRPLSALKDEWGVLGLAKRVRAFATLPPADAEAFFRRLSPPDQAELLLTLPAGERRLWMRALPPDDAVDCLQAAPSEARDGLVELKKGVGPQPLRDEWDGRALQGNRREHDERDQVDTRPCLGHARH